LLGLKKMASGGASISKLFRVSAGVALQRAICEAGNVDGGTAGIDGFVDSE
jgi:hypothetical protein